MFIKLTETHRQEIETLVSKEAELNLFIIGDLERYGFKETFLEYWGQFEGDELTGVLMRYYDGFTIYAIDQVDVAGAMAIVNQYECKTLAGGKRMLDQFTMIPKSARVRDTYFAKLDHGDDLVVSDLFNRVVKTSPEHIEQLQAMLENQIDEFDNMEPIERKRDQFINGVRRGYHIKENNQIVASAETTAENAQSAMIVAVATHPDYRGKGYATAVMSKFCGDLMAEGKTLCLFYDNPEAGLIYKRIGFEDIDVWSVWWLNT